MKIIDTAQTLPPIDWDVLPENPEERARFDRQLSQLYGSDPRVFIATSLRLWAETRGSGFFGAQCAVFANEVAKMHIAEPALEEPATPAPSLVIGPRLRQVMASRESYRFWGRTLSDPTEVTEVHPSHLRVVAEALDELDAMLAAARQAQALTNQQISDSFSFLEGLVNEDAYRRIVEVATSLAAAPQAPAAPVDDYTLVDEGGPSELAGAQAQFSIERKDGTTLAWVNGDKVAADELMHAIGAAPAAPAVDALDADRWRALESRMDEGRVSLTVHHTEADQWDGRTIGDAGELQDYADSLAAQAKEGGA